MLSWPPTEPPDVHVYDGPLLNAALDVIDRLGRGKLAPDQYQEEIADLFDRISPVEALADEVRRCRAEETDIVLYRLQTDRLRIWFQLLHMHPYEVHPPHGHRDLISNQMVLDGRCWLREYDRVARIDDGTVLLKLRSDRELKVGDRIRTTEVDRNVHWFGAEAEGAVQLNFFVTGFQEWHFDSHLTRRYGRSYYDPTGPLTRDGLIVGKEIPVEEAEARFQNRSLLQFPVDPACRVAIAA